MAPYVLIKNETLIYAAPAVKGLNIMFTIVGVRKTIHPDLSHVIGRDGHLDQSHG